MIPRIFMILLLFTVSLIVLGGATQDVFATINVGSFDESTISPSDFTFSSDGKTVFVTDDSSSIYQFSLSEPFDVTSTVTLVYTFDIRDRTDNIAAITFSDTGEMMFVATGDNNNYLLQYSLSEGFNLESTVTYDDEFDLSIESIKSIKFYNGGEIMIIVDVGSKIIQYELSTAFDIGSIVATSTTTTTFKTSGHIVSIALSDKGETLFMADSDRVYQTSLSKSFDVTSANFNGDNFDPYIQGIVSIAFSDNGKTMFILDDDNALIQQYSLSAPFDVLLPSVIFDDSFSVGSKTDSPIDIAFSYTGETMFVANQSPDRIYQYSLSTPFDVQSASYTGGFIDLLTQTSFLDGVTFSTDGHKMFVLDDDDSNNRPDRILQYTLTTAFDVTTYDTNTPVVYFDLTQTSSPRDVTFSDDGKRMFVVDGGVFEDRIFQYKLEEKFDLTIVSYTGTSFDIGAYTQNPISIAFSPDGEKMFVLSDNEYTIIQFSLSTSFNVSTASFDAIFSIREHTTNPFGLAFSDTGEMMFVGDNNNNGARILHYSIDNPFTFLPVYGSEGTDTGSSPCIDRVTGGGFYESIKVFNDPNSEVITDTFDHPTGVITDSDGRIIVVDSRNERILIFNPDGTFADSITSANIPDTTSTGNGKESGKFFYPYAVATDSNDRIIVADTHNFRILIFNPDGTFADSITSDNIPYIPTGNGEDSGEFDYIYGVTTDSNDRIIVADSGNERILIFNPDGTFADSITVALIPNQPSNFYPENITTDSNDRIIVADSDNNRIVIFDSTGTFVDSITSDNIPYDTPTGNGEVSGEFVYPSGVTTDSNNRIIVTDAGDNDRILIFDSTGKFLTSITDADGQGGEFNDPYSVTTDNKGRIIVADFASSRILIFDAIEIFTCPNSALEDTKKKGGCADCEPPTFGILRSTNAQIVSDGFTYNGQTVDVTAFHTPFPLITVHTNQLNTATVKVYENRGVDNITMVQFGLGMPEAGSPLSEAQTLVEITLYRTEVENVNVVEKYNLVDVQSVKTSLVDCDPGYDTECLEISLHYIYRDQPKYNVMAINAMDTARNSMTNYLNDGVLVIGESLNDPLLDNTITSNGGAFYPQRAGVVLLTLVDYKTDMWEDSFGYLWTGDSNNSYVLVDNIPPPARIPDVMGDIIKRNHSYFADYKQQQIIIAQKVFDGILFYKVVQGDDLTDYIALTHDIIHTERADDLELQQAIIHEQQRAQKVIDNKVW